ncbi:Plasmodium vivax Vir protein, putative [Plasmodium vivax]|uniref:Vir protein, putative n=1 Tax=Plasmodium vivax TaxID=5855 RepID=A0A1G4E8M8_PLAVI|nr:Plasmodium vivax Vir protein, putative [Plasmodium vivax]
MEYSIYSYVNKFPEFNSIISNNEITEGSADDTECKSFKENKLREYTDLNKSFIDTCSEIAGRHDKIIKKAKTSEIALCIYINYWIYDTLKSIDKFSHKELLNNFYKNIENLNFCRMYKTPIEEDIYDELKELYDLYDHFIMFKKESNENIDGSCQKAENFLQLYEKSAGKCKRNYNNYYCWELIKIRAEYEHNRVHAKRFYII